jgi:hypothetical protein
MLGERRLYLGYDIHSIIYEPSIMCEAMTE